jgi:hypothetical protein
MGFLISLVLIGGGTAFLWYRFSQSKKYSKSNSFGFAVLGYALWFLGVYIIWQFGGDVERSMLRTMPDALVSIIEWIASAIFSLIFSLAIPARKNIEKSSLGK